MGIEPTSEAWEASILPLYDARSATKLAKHFRARKHRTASNVTWACSANHPTTAILGNDGS